MSSAADKKRKRSVEKQYSVQKDLGCRHHGDLNRSCMKSAFSFIEAFPAPKPPGLVWSEVTGHRSAFNFIISVALKSDVGSWRVPSDFSEIQALNLDEVGKVYNHAVKELKYREGSHLVQAGYPLNHLRKMAIFLIFMNLQERRFHRLS